MKNTEYKIHLGSREKVQAAFQSGMRVGRNKEVPRSVQEHPEAASWGRRFNKNRFTRVNGHVRPDYENGLITVQPKGQLDELKLKCHLKNPVVKKYRKKTVDE